MPESDKTVQFLEKTEVFHGLTTDELHEVGNLFNELKFGKGETVVSVKDESDAVYLIRQGRCKVSIPFDFSMGENILSYLNEGELFGEMGVITGKKRAANISCSTDVELLSMSKDDFWEVADRYHVVLKNIIASLSERLVAQNERRRIHKRASLNLEEKQRKKLNRFYRFIEAQNKGLIERIMKTPVPQRKFRPRFLFPLKSIISRVLKYFIKLFSSPYISEIKGLENIPEDRSVIFLFSFRTFFDFLFFYKVYDRLKKDRVLSFGIYPNTVKRPVFFFFRWILSCLHCSFLRSDADDPMGGAEDTIGFLEQPGLKGRIIDIALHPFMHRSMRYDRNMGYEHLAIWLKTDEDRDIIPVAIQGTEKFWPFEPWNRKFFQISAFFNLKSVNIRIGEAISLQNKGLREEFEACRDDNEKIKSLFSRTNLEIGERLAGLEGHSYKPLTKGTEAELIRAFNERWSNRLGLMLLSGLNMRSKYRKPSIKVRHCVWHAEMLNVVLEHLEDEKYFLPDWGKGMLIAGTSFTDLEWPFFSMDHSYNPYNKKGMKLVFRFPDAMSRVRKSVDSLMKYSAGDFRIEKVLYKLGRIYHFMSDLAVPAHVHNIPHMFINFPKIGKCDFEEYLGLDNQLTTLNHHEIGDISSNPIRSFDDFYRALDDMARYTFLNSSFSYEQLMPVARDRMIADPEDRDDLFSRMRKMGVTVQPVEAYKDEERFYVRNLTSSECEEISKKTILFSLKTVTACFLFLLGEVIDRMESSDLTDK